MFALASATSYAGVQTVQRVRSPNNRAPTISSFTSSMTKIEFCPFFGRHSCSSETMVVMLQVKANDPDNDKLTYKYSATAGSILGTDEAANWDLDKVPIGIQTATVEVSDQRGGKASSIVSIDVAVCGACDSPCPTVSVTCPAEVSQGEIAVFVANVSGDEKSTYLWSHSNGKHVGQTGPELRIEAKGSPGDIISATVEVGGIEPSCSRHASCESRIAARTPSPVQQAKIQSAAVKANEDAAAIIARAREVTGFARAGQSLVHYHALAAAEQDYQSDRTYPPFFSAMQVKEGWFDPLSGVERVSTQTTYPGSGMSPAQIALTDSRRAFGLNQEKLNILPRASQQSRYLNPWNLIADWAAARDVRFAGHESYRDYSRIVLTRVTTEGEQRLLLDPKTGFPLKVELDEKHYLWGQRHIEYVYSNWTLIGGVMVAGSSFRLADGKVEISQTIDSVDLVARMSAPSTSLPDLPAQPVDELPRFLQPLELKITQVGPKTYLLSNLGYTEAVTEIGNELFLFDATQGDDRAKKDAEAIAKLFPGKHKIMLVVTDLAWPHIAGVRYWVANGATIIAHSAAREFLQKVVERRWTLAPDLLEQRRKTAKLEFVGVASSSSIAGGAVSLHPIDGIGSEVALMAYLTADRFLWASDYIQTVAEPTSYTTEVWSAVKREGLKPERTAAQHLALTPWTTIEELQKPQSAPPSN